MTVQSKEWSDWKLIDVKNDRLTYQHVRTGQRIEMLDYLETQPDEWMAELNRKMRVNGPGNWQDGRQA